MPYTQGFDPRWLMDHFNDHAADLGSSSAAQYEQMADSFLGGPLGPNTREGQRVNGDILRYNEVSEEFGVLSRGGLVRTYYKPTPAIHGYLSNLDYFLAECNR